MANPTLPVRGDQARSGWFDAIPEWLDRPGHFQGLAMRRVFAYLADAAMLFGIGLLVWLLLWFALVVSFGLLAPLLGLIYVAMPLLPLAYHTLFIGGPHSATPGMRLFDVEIRSWTGARPEYLQALLMTVLFYVSVGLTAGLILLLGIFNRRRRLMHDMLCGVVAVRAGAINAAQVLPPTGRS
ncbi:MAG: RDD family protein [Rhodospirillales bacterium]